MAESKAEYEKAVTSLRGNKFIDYKQLGMPFRLYECEVRMNARIYFGETFLTTLS